MVNKKLCLKRNPAFVFIFSLTTLIIIFILSSCMDIWGKWDNIVDPDTVKELVPSPIDGDVIYDTTPLLDWSNIVKASSYELQITNSKDSLGIAEVVSINSSDYQMVTQLDPGTWYWRIRVKNNSGIYSEWSEIWSLTVEEIVKMVDVTGGTFMMGSNLGYSDEKPVHQVTLSSFMIGKYEVTQEQYQKVMGTNPSRFTSGMEAPKRPAETVSFYDSVALCNKLSDMEGLQRVYSINGTSVTADFLKNGYRLPTEAEWEYAARGGNKSLGYSYSGSNDAGSVAWYHDNSGSTTHAVGTKAPNELDLYDMSGNVWEWCWDWYGSYPSSTQSNPLGASSGDSHVGRGGSWDTITGGLCCATRADFTPGYMHSYLGFRLLRSP